VWHEQSPEAIPSTTKQNKTKNPRSSSEEQEKMLGLTGHGEKANQNHKDMVATSSTPIVRRLRQEDHMFKFSLEQGRDAV
jgi:hypothetical protein